MNVFGKTEPSFFVSVQLTKEIIIYELSLNEIREFLTGFYDKETCKKAITILLGNTNGIVIDGDSHILISAT